MNLLSPLVLGHVSASHVEMSVPVGCQAPRSEQRLELEKVARAEPGLRAGARWAFWVKVARVASSWWLSPFVWSVTEVPSALYPGSPLRGGSEA